MLALMLALGHHRAHPNHLAWRACFKRVLIRPPRYSVRVELTVRSNNPFSRSAEVRATPSGTPGMGSGSRTVITVPSSPRLRVNVDEQRWQNQKFSTAFDFGRSPVLLSRKKNRPWVR